MQYVEIKIAQLNNRSMYSVSERINGGEWSILDYGVSIKSADEFADEMCIGYELWDAQIIPNHTVKCFYEWSDGRRTYKY